MKRGKRKWEPPKPRTLPMRGQVGMLLDSGQYHLTSEEHLGYWRKARLDAIADGSIVVPRKVVAVYRPKVTA